MSFNINQILIAVPFSESWDTALYCIDETFYRREERNEQCSESTFWNNEMYSIGK